MITGTYDGSSINTKPLHFGNQEYGEEIKNIAEQIENEMYEYIYEDKKAQLDLMPKKGKKDGEIDFKSRAAGEKDEPED